MMLRVYILMFHENIKSINHTAFGLIKKARNQNNKKSINFLFFVFLIYCFIALLF